MFLAKLKSTFRKRVSRVSCSSCPAKGFTSCARTQATKYETPLLKINIKQFRDKPARDYLSATFVYTLRAFLMNMAGPLQSSMIMGLVAEDERGAASGVSAAFWRLPNAFSTSIGASLIGIGLLAAPFYMAGIFYIVSIALFWLFFRKAKMPEEQTPS